MAVDLNVDLGTIMKSLFNKGDGASSSAGGNSDLMNSPYRNLAIAGIVAIAFIAAFIFLFYIPYSEENAKKEQELKERQNMQGEFGTLDSQAKNIKSKLNKSKEYYEDVLTYFGNSEDLRDLYQSVSSLAGKNNMVVFNIKQIPIPAPPEPKNKKKKDKKDAKPKKKIIDEIRVSLELKGGFPHYLNFKKALSEAPLLLSIHSEHVKTEEKKKDKNNAGPSDTIYVTLELSSYAINKEEYLKALESYEKEQAEVAKKQPVEDKGDEE